MEGRSNYNSETKWLRKRVIAAVTHLTYLFESWLLIPPTCLALFVKAKLKHRTLECCVGKISGGRAKEPVTNAIYSRIQDQHEGSRPTIMPWIDIHLESMGGQSAPQARDFLTVSRPSGEEEGILATVASSCRC